MIFWYKLLTYFIYPFVKIYLIYRKLKKKEHPERYKEKLAKIDIERNKGFLIWFHVASVGEGLSILPLVKYLEKNKNIKTILITSITLSSSQVLKKRLLDSKKIIHQFMPLDIPILIKRFLNHWIPNLVVFVDSEIWPNTILEIKKRDIPLLLLNARITKKTFKRWNMFKKFSRKIFQSFDLSIVANKETERHLGTLGAQNIKSFGNLKFSNDEININDNLDEKYLNKIKNRKIWCAASTHKTEELFCANTHILLKKKHKNILTIIIPRHIDRIKSIESELKKLDLKTCIYSKLNEINEDTDVLLIDAYGESTKFFKISKYVFLGGSLIKHGGQNPIEPSRLGCKIFHGPNIDNFLEIYEYLGTLKLATQIDNFEQLNQSLVEEFNSNKDNNNQIVEKVENYGQNILNNVIIELKKYINVKDEI